MSLGQPQWHSTCSTTSLDLHFTLLSLFRMAHIAGPYFLVVGFFLMSTCAITSQPYGFLHANTFLLFFSSWATCACLLQLFFFSSTKDILQLIVQDNFFRDIKIIKMYFTLPINLFHIIQKLNPWPFA